MDLFFLKFIQGFLLTGLPKPPWERQRGSRPLNHTNPAGLRARMDGASPNSTWRDADLSGETLRRGRVQRKASVSLQVHLLGGQGPGPVLTIRVCLPASRSTSAVKYPIKPVQPSLGHTLITTVNVSIVFSHEKKERAMGCFDSRLNSSNF